ncbi:MAG: family 20 glycosylhydrolase, partial [Candidatus Hydrogenedentes bacterium]|nr:family 20 glycosylhydrolase [Candidatus Hydrogenedentota bacterium]
MHMRYAAVKSVVVILLLCGLGRGLWADSAVDDLLPRPQQIQAANGTSDLDWKTAPLLLSTPSPEAGARLEARLRETSFGKEDRPVASRTGKAYALGMGHDENILLPTTIETTSDTEAYRLVVAPTEILIESASERGLFYGMMTLDQLVRGTALRGQDRLPLLEIRDWPAIPMRGPHEDFGRDQLPTMDDLKRSIRIAAQYKMNTYCWFIESDHFVYDFDPNISTEYDRFTFDEIRELVAYAKDYYIEVIPVVELLAHMEGTLNHDRYRHLT